MIAMRLGVNVPNFGPGTDPETLASWARVVEGLGFDLLMVSDHVVITPDVAARYPAPFYEPFTTLSWLAGITERVRLGTTVLIAPYRHPLLVARMAANLNRLSRGRLVLGVGIGWAKQEFAALGAEHATRGRVTSEYLSTIRTAWRDGADDYRAGEIPIWVGGGSDAALRRTVRFGDAWHPLRFTLPWLREKLPRLAAAAEDAGLPMPELAPRVTLRITDTPITGADRLACTGTLDQVRADLDELAALGARTTLLDPFNGDPEETHHPERAWQMLATVAADRDVAT